MKTLTLLLPILFIALLTFAQPDSTQIDLVAPVDSVAPTSDEFDELIETYQQPDSIGQIEGKRSKSKKSEKDTLQVRVGKHNFEITTDDSKTHIDVEKIEDFNSKWNDDEWEPQTIKTKKKSHKRKFDGHWSGFDFGGNLLLTDNNSYSIYPEGTAAFMDTRPEKSFEFNMNFAEYSFGFGSYIGFVTGLGFNFNDYQFKNRYTIAKDANGIIQPIALPEGDFRKSKLSTAYLTAPLLLEIQIPGNQGHDRMFITGGLIGGLKIGEHTKTKIGDEKLKDRGDHNIAPIRWGYTARIGFEDMGIFATYYNVKLFEDGKGPAVTPVTVGLCFTFD